MNIEQFEEYKKSVYGRRAKGFPVTRVEVSIGDWEPEPNKCHHNVTQLCVNEPSLTPVRGWLLFESPDKSFLRFVAHSVVKREDGILFDITPTTVQVIYPFIDGELSNEEFESIVVGLGTHEFDHPQNA